MPALHVKSDISNYFVSSNQLSLECSPVDGPPKCLPIDADSNCRDRPSHATNGWGHGPFDRPPSAQHSQRANALTALPTYSHVILPVPSALVTLLPLYVPVFDPVYTSLHAPPTSLLSIPVTFAETKISLVPLFANETEDRGP